MRRLAFFGWLLIPVLAGAYHYGPGQARLRLDDAAVAVDQATRLAAAGRWDAAAAAYEQAVAKLPEGHMAEGRRLRLERAKALMLDHRLPEANADLQVLVEEMQADTKVKSDPRLLAETRAALAGSEYYVTWLMKLEGLPREEWEPEIESARQTYRLLAEQAGAAGDEATARLRRDDVESAIRLALMDPGDLQGRPIPKQCQGCKSGQCKGKKPGRKPSNSKEKKDARGASSGPPPDNSGS